MEKILNKLIDKINRKLSEERHAHPNDDILSGRFMFGRHIIRFVFLRKGCEIEIYNPILETFLDNVSFYCEERVARWDDIDTEPYNEWDEHGFRDEADYINYKFR